MYKNKLSSFNIIILILGGLILLFIISPLLGMFLATSPVELFETSKDPEVTKSIWLTLRVSFLSTLFFAIGAIPLSYFLSRINYKFKNIINGIVDLPVVIPHSAAGIAILGFISRDSVIGQMASSVGLNFVGHPIGIGLAMAFVSIPFLINAARDGFENVPVKLEKTALNLGASPVRVFFTISLPLAWKNILSGLIMMFARGLSEFGAVIIVAYHPMITPVLIFERFGSFGLKYARPVSVVFILLCLVFFVLLRSLAKEKNRRMLKLKDISVKLGDFELNQINLDLDKGDYYVLLGKSGVGKTVLLEIIAGLIKPNSGQVFLKDEDITHKKIQKRKVGIVFQDFSVFPHLNVKQNIEYPLKGKKLSKKEKNDLIIKYAQLTKISHLLNRGTQNLSGGELQRVALARMLVSKPDCLLLDEPLASLDVQLKGGLRNLLREINKNGVTILHVTHDYEEAIALSNKVAVIHEGKIIQKGLTKEVFQKPANDFVANFTGIKNFFIADFTVNNTAIINEVIEIHVSNNDQLKKGKIIIRGEEIILSNEKMDSSATNNFEGIIKQTIPYLNNHEVIVDIGIELIVVISEESLLKFKFKKYSKVWVSFKSTAIKIIP